MSFHFNPRSLKPPSVVFPSVCMAERSRDISNGASERFILAHPGVIPIQQADDQERLNEGGNNIQRWPFLRRRQANLRFLVREFVRSLSIYCSLADMRTVKHSLYFCVKNCEKTYSAMY